ncbi:MAG: DUF1273 family protein [Clostridia bacterium]|nr:DUF1273 family protein [Clostridia bacterium]
MKSIPEQLKIHSTPIALKACAFTGHREIGEDLTRDSVKTAIENLIKKGVKTFYNGAAKGFDLLSAECVLELKNTYPDLKLVLCIPYYGQEKAYLEEDKERYKTLTENCDEKILLSERYYKGCLQMRNRYMCDRSDALIAYLKKNTGGTAYTVKYFQKNRKGEIVFL